jgi:hypothetical protein
MSTYPQYTLKSQDVYTFTVNTLDTLPLTMPGIIESRELMRVLVFAAASRLSVHQACQQLERAPSGPTVLGTLARQFSDLDALEAHANALLARLIPKGLGKRGRRIAIDLVALPYHGTVDAAHQDEVCRSKAKCGTTRFFTYATAYAVVRGSSLYPGDLSCAGQAAHGSRRPLSPRALDHLGYPYEASVA